LNFLFLKGFGAIFEATAIRKDRGGLAGVKAGKWILISVLFTLSQYMDPATSFYFKVDIGLRLPYLFCEGLRVSDSHFYFFFARGRGSKRGDLHSVDFSNVGLVLRPPSLLGFREFARSGPAEVVSRESP